MVRAQRLHVAYVSLPGDTKGAAEWFTSVDKGSAWSGYITDKVKLFAPS